MPGETRAGAAAARGGGQPDAEVRDEVELFGWPEQMLGCRHGPVGPPAAGVLVCLGAPFGPRLDQGRAARLARRLARRGVAVQRFHPRGSPPSDGHAAGVDFGSLVEDAARALDLLRERTGVERVGFVGARLGALVVARLARADGAAPVAMWEPVIDPRAVLEAAARARAGAGGAGGAGGAEEGTLDVFATGLCAELIDGTAVGDLDRELGARRGGLLAVQTGPGEGPAPALRSLVERCRARQVALEVRCHPCDAERDGAVVPGVPADALVETTASWLSDRLLAGGGAAAPPDRGNGLAGAP